MACRGGETVQNGGLGGKMCRPLKPELPSLFPLRNRKQKGKHHRDTLSSIPPLPSPEVVLLLSRIPVAGLLSIIILIQKTDRVSIPQSSAHRLHLSQTIHLPLRRSLLDTRPHILRRLKIPLKDLLLSGKNLALSPKQPRAARSKQTLSHRVATSYPRAIHSYPSINIPAQACLQSYSFSTLTTHQIAN